MQTGSLGKLLVGSLISTAAIRYPDNEAVYCSATGRRFTYRSLNARVNRLAHGLTGLGFAKGDVVAFLSTNRAEVPEIYFALAKSGIVGIPLNYRLAPAEMLEMMRSMGARGLILEKRFEEVAQRVRNELPRAAQFVVIDDERSSFGIGYEALLASSAETEPAVELDELDPYYFNLTSGTTGLPKSYLLAHCNFKVMGPLFQTLDMTRKDVVLTVFPMFGRVGFAGALAAAMYGVKNVIANFDAEQTLALIEQERVTTVNLVATMATMLLAAESLPRRDLPSLRAVAFTGSILPAPLREQTMARLCPRLYEFYGMQESGALVISTPEDRAKRPDSVGRALLFAEFKVIDADGRDVPAGQIGEIIGRSPSGITAYFADPVKTAATFRDGWLHTGDLGRVDEEGFLYICGRVKDMIISGGQNVHSAEVEEAILSFPGVADCAVIGLPDPLWGERVVAVVIASAAASVDAEALRVFCRERLAGFKTPKQFLMRNEPLPRTPTGKVQKFLLVEQYGSAGS